MLRRKMYVVITAVSLVLMLCGCAGSKVSTLEKIEKQLGDMQSYQCEGNLTRIGSKNTNEYGIKQYFKVSGEYKLELLSPESVSGNYTVFDGKTVCQYNARLGGSVILDLPDDKQRSELFLGQFIKNYTQSEDATVDVDKLEDEKCTVLEAVIPGANKYTATEKLWVDNETLKPVKFVIYDSEGAERYIIDYTAFEYDVEFEENFFKIDK